MSRDEREKQYLERFATLPPEEKRIHFTFALRFLVDILKEKHTIGPTAIEGNVIDGEYTIGGAA